MFINVTIYEDASDGEFSSITMLNRVVCGFAVIDSTEDLVYVKSTLTFSNPLFPQRDKYGHPRLGISRGSKKRKDRYTTVGIAYLGMCERSSCCCFNLSTLLCQSQPLKKSLGNLRCRHTESAHTSERVLTQELPKTSLTKLQ